MMKNVSWTLNERRRQMTVRRWACLVVLMTAALAVGSLSGQEEDLFSSPPAETATEAPAEPAADAPAAPEPDAFPADTPAAKAPAESTPTARHDNYLVWMIRSLGWFFTPVFLFLSMTMVALMVMNIFSIRRSSLVPEELVRQFDALLEQQKYQDAYQLAATDESMLGKVLAVGLSRAHSGGEKAGQAMQDVAQEETMKLEHQIGYLALIGNLAPMVGLFGTVVGMIDAFQVIASGGAAPSPQKLAEGIATALFTTMVGLAIALPSLAVYDVFKNRLARYLLEIGIISDNLIARIAGGMPGKKQ
ncbi:MAG: MotA/TolQ/ExbB proton channel family protein [Planctomycetia bacterium]|nr:MotA/TolQ/ExbB proton channel family protein [Planctomycetia bacterium]